MSYGKHWETMYTGSMYGVGLGVFAVWGYVIANTEMDHTIEMNPQRLSDTLGCTVEQIETALAYLCAPDDNSRNKAEHGARLVKTDAFRYFVVNHETYRTMRNNEDRREYFRIKQQESRARKDASNPHVKLSNTHVNMSTQTETETETEELSCAPATADAPPKADPIPYQAIVDLYNASMLALPKARDLTPKRKTLIRSAWQASPSRRGLKFWTAYFAECQDDGFLNGDGPYREPHASWRPGFDYLLTEKTVTKVYERAMDKFDREARQ